ncbi:MAG TPA: hypothetical protein VL974_04135, partial [Magnetospirillum sp.]|nr:hypothetical protein [Magnetospirillum sp.]
MANGNSSLASLQIGGGTTLVVGDGSTNLTGTAGNDILIAEPQLFTANLAPVNGSGVAGTVQVSLDATGLRVQVDATGLEPGQHQMGIDGPVAAGHTPQESFAPTASLDTDHDGFIENAEAQRSLGPQLMDLGTQTVGADGTLHFDHTFALNDLSGLTPGATLADLLPLDFRAIELHGMSVAAGPGAGTSGEVDGTAGFKAALPVASA